MGVIRPPVVKFMPHCKKLIRTLKSALPSSATMKRAWKWLLLVKEGERRRTEGKGTAQNELNIRPKLTRLARLSRSLAHFEFVLLRGLREWCNLFSANAALISHPLPQQLATWHMWRQPWLLPQEGSKGCKKSLPIRRMAECWRLNTSTLKSSALQKCK